MYNVLQQDTIMTVRLIIVAVAAIITTTAVGAQNYKIGVVNTEVIMKELPETVKASKAIEEQQLKYRDTLQMMQKEFESRAENYGKQEAMMTADAKRKEQEALMALQQRFRAYQEEKTVEMKKMQEDLLQPIRQKVTDAINAVAKEEKLTIVLEKAFGLVLYSEDKADVTYKVLDRMKRGSN